MWYNSKTSLLSKLSKGFSTIGDILENDGKLVEREILVKAQWKINPLEYVTLLFNIVNLHKGIEKCIPKVGSYIPLLLQKTGCSIKGCSMTYTILQNYNHPYYIGSK